MIPFSNIYELSLVIIEDYAIDKLFNPSDMTAFNNRMRGYLLKAIPKFTNSQQSLEYTKIDGEYFFNDDLTNITQDILSELLIIEWLDNKINDVTQFQGDLKDTDYKKYAESQNLTAKVVYRDKRLENVNNYMTVYAIKAVNPDKWNSWLRGEF